MEEKHIPPLPVDPIIEEEAHDFNEPVLPYLMLRLEKTACYGECPVFELKLYSDGKVLWHGEYFCKRLGWYEAFLPEDKVEELKKQTGDVDIFSLLDHYPPSGPYLSELPNTILYYNDGQREKSISQNYLSPQSLIQFEEEILRIADKLIWGEIEHEN